MASLSELRDLLYLGLYDQLSSSSSSYSSSSSSSDLPQLFLLRCQLAQRRYSAVISTIGALTSPSPDFLSLKLLAQYLSALDSLKLETAQDYVNELHQLCQNSEMVSPIQVITLATMLAHEDRLEDALEYLGKHPRNLECNALTIQVYLMMDRWELAERMVESMKGYAEDSVLYQLAEAWVNLAMAKGKQQSAFYTFEELGGNSPSPALLNAQAVCHLYLSRNKDAESLLSEAIAKNSNDPNVLVNIAVCHQLNDSNLKEASVYINQLGDIAPNHPHLHHLKEWSSTFDKATERYQKLIQ